MAFRYAMDSEYAIRRILLQIPEEAEALRAFLASFSLRLEPDIQVAFGIFDHTDRLCGCGCAAGFILKCFAVSEELRGNNALGSLTSALLTDCFSRGIYHVMVYTRRHNASFFHACGFHTVAATASLVLLENIPNGPERFTRQFFHASDQDLFVGAVVVNCNPFTLGHRALIEYAASNCDLLHVFVVEENRSAFCAADRFHLVAQGTRDLSNVRVHLSSRYIISDATFPRYFLKECDDAAAMQAELDISLFAQRIAPALHIQIRFAGEEPTDPTTACYNRFMRSILPRSGIRFCEIPRFCIGGQAISASVVRKLLAHAETWPLAMQYLPPVTVEYLNSKRSPGEIMNTD